ncbi:sulfite exporter TauE/SafE family protein [Caldimonas caldifontis]|uniref:Probable membrane transporter protein n=1 Tax=Caldimonas caldifontis TaxID=1452508 RepID=A0A2S5SZ63_9BURK|nr:sulfite exporter TauE/SafE family protein [Caldimonas caldifontis]
MAELTRWLITDPWFYAAAIPAVLLMGLSKSGFGSGFGSLAVPIMALTISVPQAAAIMLPLLAVMDVLGVTAYRRHVDLKLIRLLLPAGLVGTVVGMLLFGVLSPTTVAAVVGGLTLAFLAQRLFFPPRADAPPPPLWLGRLLAVASGFTSFVAHAGGPPINAYVLPLRLSPVVFSATMAVFFAAVNASKWIPYAWLGLIDWRNMITALALMPFAPMGVWLGVRLVHRVRQDWFYRLVYAGMFLTGCKLLWDGLR